MSHTLSDYFALEAGEYLEQLDALLGQPGTPDADRLLRLARGVRGSARMADERAIAGVAERLEGAARALHERALPWSEPLRACAIRTVDDLKVLVRARGKWGPAEETRARDAAARWDAFPVGGRAPAPAAAPGMEQLLPFVRREVMAVVSELEHVLEDLRRSPESREPLRGVVRRMRPLRGVTGLEVLAPVLEVLEGVEDTAAEILSRSAPVTGAYQQVLAEAATALQRALVAVERSDAAAAEAALEPFRAARDGVAESDSSEAEDDESVVPISDLFFDDAGPHVLSSPLAPTVPEGRAEAEPEVERFLRLEATAFLDRAEALIANLSPREERRFGRVAAQLARLARSVAELAETYGLGETARGAERATAELRAARSAAEAREALARLRASLPGSTAAASDAAPPAPDAEGVVPVESLLLRGEAALREALGLRPEIERLATDGGGSPELRDRLAELFDLVTLGLEAPAAG